MVTSKNFWCYMTNFYTLCLTDDQYELAPTFQNSFHLWYVQLNSQMTHAIRNITTCQLVCFINTYTYTLGQSHIIISLCIMYAFTVEIDLICLFKYNIYT